MGSKIGEGSQMNEGGQKGVKWGQKLIFIIFKMISEKFSHK
jgi:hypothetical protein